MINDFFSYFASFFRRLTAVLLAATAIVFPFFGCSRTSDNELFFYRDADIRAEIALTCNGSDSVFLYERVGGRGLVTFTAPEELAGFSLELTSEGASVIYGDLRADAPEGMSLIPRLIGEIFALSPQQISRVETVENEQAPQEPLTKIVASGISVTVDRGGIPVSAEGVLLGVSFQANVTDFEVILDNSQ